MRRIYLGIVAGGFGLLVCLLVKGVSNGFYGYFLLYSFVGCFLGYYEAVLVVWDIIHLLMV